MLARQPAMTVNSDYLHIHANSEVYADSMSVPLDFWRNPDGLFHLKVIVFCQTACHNRDELFLRVRPVVSNTVKSPSQLQFSVIQESATSSFPFETVPYGVGRIYKWTSSGWQYRT